MFVAEPRYWQRCDGNLRRQAMTGECCPQKYRAVLALESPERAVGGDMRQIGLLLHSGALQRRADLKATAFPSTSLIPHSLPFTFDRGISSALSCALSLDDPAYLLECISLSSTNFSRSSSNQFGSVCPSAPLTPLPISLRHCLTEHFQPLYLPFLHSQHLCMNPAIPCVPWPSRRLVAWPRERGALCCAGPSGLAWANKQTAHTTAKQPRQRGRRTLLGIGGAQSGHQGPQTYHELL
jgi:hypothetical protein